MPKTIITRVVADNVKGRSFIIDFGPDGKRSHLFLGRNGTGKTSRLAAVDVALRKTTSNAQAVPPELGETAEDSGLVTVRVSAECGGVPLAMSRTLGPEHAVSVSPNGQKPVKAPKAAEDILAEKFGTRRAAVLSMSSLSSMTGPALERMLRLVAAKALAPEQRPTVETLVKAVEETTFLRELPDGQRIKEPMPEAVLKEVRQAVDYAEDNGEDVAADPFAPLASGLGAARTEALARKKQAVALRDKLTSDVNASLPAGTAEHWRGEAAKLRDELEAVRAAIRTAAADKQLHDQLVEQQRNTGVELEAAEHELADRLRGLTVEALKGAAQKATEALAAARTVLDSSRKSEVELSRDIEAMTQRGLSMKDGKCPTCENDTAAVEVIVARLRVDLKRLKERRAVAQDAVRKLEETERQRAQEALAFERRTAGLDRLVERVERLRAQLQAVAAKERPKLVDVSGETRRAEDLTARINQCEANARLLDTSEADAKRRAENEQAIEREEAIASAAKAALEVVNKKGREVVDAAKAVIEGVAGRLVSKCYDDGTSFAFRKEGTSFGFVRNGRFIPAGALSASEQTVCVAAIFLARAVFETDEPMSFVAVDGLEEMDFERGLRFFLALHEEVQAGNLSGLAATMKFDGGSDLFEVALLPDLALRGTLAGSGVRVVDVERDTAEEPRFHDFQPLA